MNFQSLRTDDCVEKIINKYSKTVYKLAFAQTRNKNDADDIFQEVFLRYIRKQPTFENKEHEKAWFIRVTINCCKSLWKSPFKKHTQLLEQDTFVIENNEENLLEEYLLKLPKVYRIVIHLFYYENMPTAQISTVIKKKESTVRMQLTRARRLLKEYMEGDNFHAR